MITSNLRTALTDVYLPGVTPQQRDRLLSVIPADVDPEQNHQRLRELAGLMKLPHAVVSHRHRAVGRYRAAQ
ncbi:hypothetical protein LTT66_32030 [Nocardia gipuzkoensis]|uniref:hypothetical protein n=1 Tax=Nocardia gipuzkoensis TaxID=2749991 RepID=UPI001E43AE03|nr:hypothetical protein [Nocardia gipuzkoensis]UGT67772.1 hypothetical protein LTT66_32030 [Nocardia gipuzkoensis]